MDKNFKKQLFLIAFGVLLFAVTMNFSAVLKFLGFGFDIIFPLLIGGLVAFVLNVPMKTFEKTLQKLNRKFKKKSKDGTIRIISVLLTYFTILLLVILVFTLVIPAFVSSLKSIYEMLMERLPIWSEKLKAYDINVEAVTNWLETLDIKQIVSELSVGAGSLFSTVADFLSGVFSGIGTLGVAFVVSIYSLLYKDDLLRQATNLINAFFKENIAKKITYVGSLINKTYAKFLTGQCTEACILGILMAIVLSLFRIPYSGLIGLLAAVMSFVPYVGAFFACVIGAFLVLLNNPTKAIICVIVYLIVQYIENQFIYPYVVGTSVGLSPLWTLVAVLIGNELMGLFGMIFFIPLMAVVFQLLKEYTNNKLLKKQANSMDAMTTEDTELISDEENIQDTEF